MNYSHNRDLSLRVHNRALAFNLPDRYPLENGGNTSVGTLQPFQPNVDESRSHLMSSVHYVASMEETKNCVCSNLSS